MIVILTSTSAKTVLLSATFTFYCLDKKSTAEQNKVSGRGRRGRGEGIKNKQTKQKTTTIATTTTITIKKATTVAAPASAVVTAVAAQTRKKSFFFQIDYSNCEGALAQDGRFTERAKADGRPGLVVVHQN